MYDGAVMITASHLPAHRNGFKFFTKSGGLNNQDIAEVLGFLSSVKGDGSNKHVPACRHNKHGFAPASGGTT